MKPSDVLLLTIFMSRWQSRHFTTLGSSLFLCIHAISVFVDFPNGSLISNNMSSVAKDILFLFFCGGRNSLKDPLLSSIED